MTIAHSSLQLRWAKNVSARQRQGRQSCFPIGFKNTNLVEGIKLLLLVKFCWISFSSFREVENVTADQRPGRPFCFSGRPEKHKLWRWPRNLSAYQVLLNSVQRFQRRSRKCLSQSEAGWPSCFSDRHKKHKLCREYWDLSSCQVSLNSVGNVSANKRPGWPSCFSDRSEKKPNW